MNYRISFNIVGHCIVPAEDLCNPLPPNELIARTQPGTVAWETRVEPMDVPTDSALAPTYDGIDRTTNAWWRSPPAPQPGVTKEEMQAVWENAARNPFPAP